MNILNFRKMSILKVVIRKKLPLGKIYFKFVQNRCNGILYLKMLEVTKEKTI